jgi:DNA-binding response OmpR family regulator
MTKQRLILIVEDEPDAARLVAFHLQHSGFQTITAPDGPAGLDAVAQYQPDLLILDLMLPGLPGLEVCRRLKSDPQTQHLPILLLTALSGIEDKLRGFGRGADDYLTKPFETSELVVRVHALLRRAGADRPARPGEPASIREDVSAIHG